jgi:hypothetical protein
MLNNEHGKVTVHICNSLCPLDTEKNTSKFYSGAELEPFSYRRYSSAIQYRNTTIANLYLFNPSCRRCFQANENFFVTIWFEAKENLATDIMPYL